MKKVVFIILLALSFINQTKAQRINYFPKSCGLNVFKMSWYSGELKKMNEPVLFTNRSTNEIYRFTWLRSFDAPVVIRIERHNNSYSLYWKITLRDGSLLKKSKTITKDDWDYFQYRLRQIGFWQLSTKEDSEWGTDGSEWILEGKLADRYHVVDRWTPHQGSAYYKCCDLLIGLTDLNIPSGRKY